MPGTYVTTDLAKWGVGKGVKHTAAEADNEIWKLWQEIANTLASIPAGVGIANIFPSGGKIVIVLDDATEYEIDYPPVRYNFVGSWAATTEYFGGDIVLADGHGIYLVLQNHTTGATFDPGLQVDGFNAYQQLYGVPNSTTKVIAGATYTLLATDANKYLRCTAAGGCTVTVPTNASAAIQVNAEYTFRQAAAGAITFAAEGGAVLNGVAGLGFDTAGQGSVAVLKKIATDEWDLFGRLTTV